QKRHPEMGYRWGGRVMDCVDRSDGREGPACPSRRERRADAASAPRSAARELHQRRERRRLYEEGHAARRRTDHAEDSGERDGLVRVAKGHGGQRLRDLADGREGVLTADAVSSPGGLHASMTRACSRVRTRAYIFIDV